MQPLFERLVLVQGRVVCSEVALSPQSTTVLPTMEARNAVAWAVHLGYLRVEYQQHRIIHEAQTRVRIHNQ